MASSSSSTLDGRTDIGTTGLRHFVHPTNPAKHWCGRSKRATPIGAPTVREFDVDCVVCIDLWLTFGTDGWLAGKVSL